MPTPLPAAADTDLQPPDADEVELLARGVASAIRPPGGLTELQTLLLDASFAAMTGFTVAVDGLAPVGAEDDARGLARRNEAFRSRMVQAMIMGALVLRPLPAEVAAQVAEYARALSVDDGMLAVAQRFATGNLGLAAFDFERNGYTDWFALADRPVAELRDAFGIVDKLPEAVAAGSVGPWEPGGISDHQYDTARERAAAEGRVYDAHGAVPR